MAPTRSARRASAAGDVAPGRTRRSRRRLRSAAGAFVAGPRTRRLVRRSLRHRIHLPGRPRRSGIARTLTAVGLRRRPPGAADDALDRRAIAPAGGGRGVVLRVRPGLVSGRCRRPDVGLRRRVGRQTVPPALAGIFANRRRAGGRSGPRSAGPDFVPPPPAATSRSLPRASPFVSPVRGSAVRGFTACFPPSSVRCGISALVSPSLALAGFPGFTLRFPPLIAGTERSPFEPPRGVPVSPRHPGISSTFGLSTRSVGPFGPAGAIAFTTVGGRSRFLPTKSVTSGSSPRVVSSWGSRIL